MQAPHRLLLPGNRHAGSQLAVRQRDRQQCRRISQITRSAGLTVREPVSLPHSCANTEIFGQRIKPPTICCSAQLGESKRSCIAWSAVQHLAEGSNAHKVTLVQSTGVEFPEVTTLWDGDKMRSVGAGVRAKRFGFLPVKVLPTQYRASAALEIVLMPQSRSSVPTVSIGGFMSSVNCTFSWCCRCMQ